MALRQLIYTSELSVPIHKLESELRRIIEVAERKNPQAGITGCLMVSGSRVVQFLEGPPDAVDDLYQKIKRDERHTSVVLLYRDDATEREAAQWAMCLCRIDATTQSLGDLTALFDASRATFKFHFGDFRDLMKNYLFQE